MSIRLNNQSNNKNQDRSKQFYDRFKGIIPSIQSLKNISHIGSFGTQIVAIFPMALAYLPFQSHWINIPLACLICLSFGVIIEVGISTFLPVSVRQVVGREFYNKWFIAMFLAIFIFIVLPLLIASPTLSSIGGQTIGEIGFEEEKRPSTDTLNQQHKTYILQLDSLAKQQKKELQKATETETTPIKNKYAGLMQIQQNVYNKYNTYQKQTGKAWPRKNMLDAKNNIQALKAEMNDHLTPILSAQKQNILAINAKLNKDKAQADSLHNSRLSIINADYDKDQKGKDFKKWIWSSIGIFLAAFFSFGTIISIIIMIIFEKGSGNSYQALEATESGNFIQNFLEDISGKFAETFAIAKAVKPEPKRRTIGFNKNGKSVNERLANIDLEITNESKSGNGKENSKSGKKPDKSTVFPTKKRKSATSKAEGTESKAEAENRKIVQASKSKISAIKKAENNPRKVTQKEVAKDTGFSEKTVRKYWR